MEKIFNAVLNMSITGVYITAAIVILRLFMKKLPKQYSYAMWSILGIRLLCPFSFSSVFSIFNLFKPAETGTKMQYIPHSVAVSPQPDISVGIPPVNEAITTAATAVKAADTRISVDTVLTIVWCIGAALMIAYTLTSYFLVFKRVSGSELLHDNVYRCSRTDTPFVFGIIKPRIYLPDSISEDDTEYVLSHERTHIRRGDPLIKLGAMFILSLHWFNPAVWAAYILMVKDMELSCDERALSAFNTDARRNYASALLNISMHQNGLSFRSAVGFGESNIKTRIKNVLGYKKPALSMVIVSIAAVTAAGLVLITNSSKSIGSYDSSDISNPAAFAISTVSVPGLEEQLAKPAVMNERPYYSEEELRERYPGFFGLNAFKGLEIYVYQFSENEFRCAAASGTNLYGKSNDFIASLSENTASIDEMISIIGYCGYDPDDIVLYPVILPDQEYRFEINKDYISKVLGLFSGTGIENYAAAPVAEIKIDYKRFGTRSVSVDPDDTDNESSDDTENENSALLPAEKSESMNIPKKDSAHPAKSEATADGVAIGRS